MAPPVPARSRSPAVGALVVVVGALLLLEIVLRLLTASGSFGGLPLLPWDPMAPIRAVRATDLTQSYLIFDVDLGWTVGSSRRSANGLYHSTSFGARETAAGPELKAGERTWALCFGDSFTHGDDVPGEATWEALLSRRLGRTVLNFGVPGYGVDQALIRYRKLAADWPSDRVLIGFMADNIGRHLSRYRPFLSPEERVFFAKPRFLLAARGLELLPQPFGSIEEYFSPAAEAKVRSLAEHDRWFRSDWYDPRALDAWRTARVVRTILAGRHVRSAPWRELYTDPPAVELTSRLIREFARAVQVDGREPVVVFFPDKTMCRDALQKKDGIAAGLLAALRKDGLTVVDLTDPLVAFLGTRAPMDAYFLPHYSRELNEVVGKTLAEVLAPSK